MIAKIGDLPPVPGTGASSGSVKDVGKDFDTFMQEATTSAMDTMYKGENMAMMGITGEADLADVVAAVSSAETTLQTVTALRDRMMQAYQEIIRMPI